MILVEFHNEVKGLINLLAHPNLFLKQPVQTWGHAYPGVWDVFFIAILRIMTSCKSENKKYAELWI